MLRTSQQTIILAIAALRKDDVKEVFIHGFGNVYTDAEKSNFRRDFCPVDMKEAEYVLKIGRGDKMPKTVEELNAMLEKAYVLRKNPEPAPINNFGVNSVSADEMAEIEAEISGKAKKQKETTKGAE